MKLHHYADTDSLYIELAEGAGVETREVVEGVNVDIGADGAVVRIDIDGASRNLNWRPWRPTACRSAASSPRRVFADDNYYCAPGI